MKMLLYIGIGSFLGGVARYGLTRFVAAGVVTELPFGTFVVNVVGCFLLGLLYQLFSSVFSPSDGMRLLLTVGFCGGFTTFSTFVAEDFAMLSAARFFVAAAYAVVSVVVGLVAMWLGVRCVEMFS